ncbi:MAG: hypothetical protein JXJ22_03340 [Bacteroidales bacterium]|nr:hypothetical protein [Bacteroidales bacterium]
MKSKKIIVSVCILIFAISLVHGQDIEDMVSKYTQENGQGYMQPLADAFGATFNSGLYHSASIKKLGFQAYLGVVSSFAFIPDSKKTFEATTEGFFEPVTTADVPTIFGAAESVEVDGNGGTTYVFPAGLNVSMVPFIVPQLTIGSVYGTDLTLRYFSVGINEELGDVKLFSWGIRHSISQHFDLLPVDIAVGFYSQTFSIGDLVSAKASVINAQVSRNVMLFTFYGGLGYENSNLDIKYTNTAEDTEISFKLKGNNKIRFTAGVTFNLGPVKINVDYNLSDQSVLCAGLGFGIGK